MSERKIVDCMAEEGDIVRVRDFIMSEIPELINPLCDAKACLEYQGQSLLQDVGIAECGGQYFTVKEAVPGYKDVPKYYKFYGCDYLFPWWVVEKIHIGTDIEVSGARIYLKEVPPKIKQVKFSNPATIVWFEDGDKVVVKANKGDRFDGEKGLAMALCKKVYGSDYYNLFKKFVWGKKDKLKVGDRVKQGKILKFNKQGSKALVQTKTKQIWIDRKSIEGEK